MKTKLTALALITVTALSLAPKPAQASDKGLAVLGGFIGGVLVASAINDSRHDNYSDCNTTVVVNDRYDYRNECRDEGYWKVVTVRSWIPGCWIVERGNHGRSFRRYVEGHYESRNDRLWVAYDRHDRRDRHDRDVAYGYGRDHNRR